MDRKAEEASEVQRKSVVILSDRSREIIRRMKNENGNAIGFSILWQPRQFDKQLQS